MCCGTANITVNMTQYKVVKALHILQLPCHGSMRISSGAWFPFCGTLSPSSSCIKRCETSSLGPGSKDRVAHDIPSFITSSTGYVQHSTPQVDDSNLRIIMFVHTEVCMKIPFPNFAILRQLQLKTPSFLNERIDMNA
jgi:hypothetical protein